MGSLKAEVFWERVENVLDARHESWKVFCDGIGIPYRTVQDQRTHKTLPKLDQVVAMAEYLDMAIDELIYGFHGKRVYTRQVKDIADALMHSDSELVRMVERLLGLNQKQSVGITG